MNRCLSPYELVIGPLISRPSKVFIARASHPKSGAHFSGRTRLLMRLALACRLDRPSLMGAGVVEAKRKKCNVCHALRPIGFVS